MLDEQTKFLEQYVNYCLNKDSPDLIAGFLPILCKLLVGYLQGICSQGSISQYFHSFYAVSTPFLQLKTMCNLPTDGPMGRLTDQQTDRQMDEWTDG